MVINGSGSPLKDMEMENQPTFQKLYSSTSVARTSLEQ